MCPSTPFLTRNLGRLGDTDTAAGSKCPDVPVDGCVGSQSHPGGAGDGTTCDELRAAEAVGRRQGCKGELAHSGAWDASLKPRWIAQADKASVEDAFGV